MPTGSGMWTYPPIISGSNFNAVLKDGIINYGVTFPTSKIEGKMYYRTDRAQLYIYSGSTWVYVPRWSTVPDTIVTGSLTAGKNIIQLTSGSDMNVNDLLDCLWHFDGSGSGATWDATSYVMPSGSKGVLQWKDDVGYGSGDYMDVFMIRSSNEPSNPILYASQHIIAKKDITAGGLIGTNQGAVYIGSGLTAINDQPTIILMHYGTGSDYTKYGDVPKNTLHIEDIDGNLAHLACANIISSGSLTVTGSISGSSYLGLGMGAVQAGQASMSGGTGSVSVTFDREFSATPFVTATVQDTFGTLQRSINVISKSTTGFRVTVNIGQHLHVGSGNTGTGTAHLHSNSGQSTTGSDHTHGDAGTTGVPSASGSVITEVSNWAVGSGHEVGGETGIIESGSAGNEHTHGFAASECATDIHLLTTGSFATYAHTHNFSSDTGTGSGHKHAFTNNTGNESSHTHTTGNVANSGSMGSGYDTTFDWIAVGAGYA